jgi:hypothetical protein
MMMGIILSGLSSHMKETLANNPFPPQINSYQRKLEAIIVQLATCYDESCCTMKVWG